MDPKDKSKENMQKEENLYGYDIEETVSTNDYTGLIPSLIVEEEEAEAYEQLVNITKQIPAEQEEDKTVDGK